MPTTSANTETTVCFPSCDGSLIEVIPPHPVWTGIEGNDVIQMNAVTLGGINGLNN